MKATIITVGDEILIGQVIDTNSAWMATELNALGIDVKEILSVNDKHDAIVEAIDRAFANSDVVFMSGGLGPTKDDITKKAIADYFGVGMVFDETIHKIIVDLFNKLDRPLSPSHKDQCFMPTNAIILSNKMGTAPGMLFHKDDKMLFSMPGVPYEMMYIFSESIIDILKKKIGTNSFISHRTLMTVGEGETFLADKIEHVVDTFPPELSIAYLPSLGSVRLRITGKSNSANISSTVAHYAALVEKEIEKNVYGYDNETLEAAIKRLLDSRNWKLATAESCTGGYLSHKITSIPGSSSYFLGGIVSYSNEMKENILGVKKETLNTYGAVSEQTVIEMANGCKNLIGSDIAISISGIAGPDGGSTEKPVGTIWFALAYPGEVTKAYKLTASKNRLKNIEYASNVIMGKVIHKLLAK